MQRCQLAMRLSLCKFQRSGMARRGWIIVERAISASLPAVKHRLGTCGSSTLRQE